MQNYGNGEQAEGNRPAHATSARPPLEAGAAALVPGSFAA
jgi:hypothetical protein